MALLLGLTPEGSLREELGYGLRVSARLAFAALLIAYIARPWRQLTGGGRWLLRHRRYFGLAAALTHTVHFGYIVALFVLTDEVLEVTTAIFGGLAYVLIWIMALTSNRASQRRLGANWARLHRFAMHYLWLVFYASLCRGRYCRRRSLVYWYRRCRAGGADAQNCGVVALSVQSHSIKSAESAGTGTVVQQYVTSQLEAGFTGGF